MADYTVVEPHMEYFERTDGDYLQFLERCGRTCYKSEDRICEGSAEKLLTSITKRGHLSVLEHENNLLYMNFDEPQHVSEAFYNFVVTNPFFAFRITVGNTDMLVSGNIRMWMEFLRDYEWKNQVWYQKIEWCLHKQWPFFFPREGINPQDEMIILDPNPVTNKSELKPADMKKHMCMTYKLVGSRAMSHQLVRHRLCSFCVDGEAITELTVEGRSVSNGRKFKQIKKRTIKQLFKMKQTPHGRSRLKLVMINCLNEKTGQITRNKILDVVYSGKKPCISIKTEDGYEIKTTKDHLFLTPNGWLRLEKVLERDLPVSTNGIDMPDIEWLREEYLVKNRTRKNIADEIGISDSWLGKYIKQCNLQKPKSMHPNKKPGHGVKGMHGEEGRKAISERMKGSGNHRWRGGITAEAVQIRADNISKEFRQEIYTKDDFTCRLCYTRGGKLTLHHIVPVWQDKSLVGEPNNLITLCRQCHCKINGHEHEYTDYFSALKPIEPRPNIKKSDSRKFAKFSKIIKSTETEPIDTYDIIMSDPHHNFVANGFVVHNSQESQRFCDYGKKGFQFISPPAAEEKFNEDMVDGYDTYLHWRELGLKPEDARFAIPGGCKTEVTTSCTLSNWGWIFSQRADNNHAQWEIKSITQDIKNHQKEVVPEVFSG
jgi:thymidylate synthase ThyX